jgi:hypothetical protein
MSIIFRRLIAMKKFAVSIGSVILISLTGAAFAMPGGSALSKVLAATDAQLVPLAADAVTVEVPVPAGAALASVKLSDITERYTKDGEVEGSYPAVYAQVHKEENWLIKKVFGFTAPDGSERRIEVMLTGGDWMPYGLIYLITNAGQDKDKASAYFMPQLSTPDHENGEVPPAVDPGNLQQLTSFIVSEFLNPDGSLKPGYTSVATAPAAQ